MTSHCLCLREERTVTCLILRIVNFLFYLKVSYNFLYNIQPKIFTQLKIFHSQPKFFHSQPKIFSLTSKFFHSQLKFFLSQPKFFHSQLNFPQHFAINFVKRMKFSIKTLLYLKNFSYFGIAK